MRAPSGRRFLQVELTLENNASESPIPAGWSAFTLTTLSGSSHAADRTSSTSSPCSDTTLALRASRTCSLAFDIAIDARPGSLAYQTGGRTISASFDAVSGPPMLCSEPSEESTVVACSDGCNNDGDPYLDCNDADCCTIRPDCPSGTYCGGSPIECVSGPEGTLDGCRDTCDNEGDDVFDCADSDCCDLVSCTADTFCGQQPDPFASLAFDSGIASIDPTKLRAGTNPCRAPVLVWVDYVNDGDTIEVSGPITGLVRMIGIDTPEVGRDGAPSECYADQAWSFAQALRGRQVWLTFDEECADQYGRHLAFVHVGPNSPDLFQRHVLRRGFGSSLVVSPNDSLSELFEHDEALAAQASAGLWAACP
jgi:endonuclease YncB( thermonuclease family)